MTWNLFIDDERNPEDVTWAPWQVREKYRNEEWVVARNMWEVQSQMISHGAFPSFVSFDHDLGENQPSGHEIAKYMVDVDMMKETTGIPENFDFYVHSKNVVGAKNIKSYLENYLVFKNSE